MLELNILPELLNGIKCHINADITTTDNQPKLEHIKVDFYIALLNEIQCSYHSIIGHSDLSHSISFTINLEMPLSSLS